LALVRSGAVSIDTDNEVATAFLGNVEGFQDWTITGLTIAQLCLQVFSTSFSSFAPVSFGRFEFSFLASPSPFLSFVSPLKKLLNIS